MPYSYKEVPEAEQEATVVELEKGAMSYPNTPLSVFKPRVASQYSIKDEQGDEICVVYSELDAEALMTHLNR